MTEITDPRTFGATVPEPEVARLRALAAESLGADTAARSDAADREVRTTLGAWLNVGAGRRLAALIDDAPSVAAARYFWRQLDVVACTARQPLAVTIFALPIIVVAGIELDAGNAEARLPAVLADTHRLAAILEAHNALSGNRSFGFANALVAAEAIDIARLPDILAWQRLPDAADGSAPSADRALVPAPLPLVAGSEGAHLRFLVGSAVGIPGANLFAGDTIAAWGMPFAQEIGRQLRTPGASVLALPRPPDRLLPAVWAGRVAQREVAASLFATNAIRKFRATVGEPAAVISAHRVPGAGQGGELRLSLASPFGPRDAEGFRCPLYPLDRVGDVVVMLTRLLGDCRVADVRLVPGIHGDRDPATGLPLLFKLDTIPAGAVMH